MFKIVSVFFLPDVTSTHVSQWFNAKKDTVQIVDVENPFGHFESISWKNGSKVK